RHADDRHRRKGARRRAGRGQGPAHRRAAQRARRRGRCRAVPLIVTAVAIEAVLFDWGGTLTTFHSVDMIDAWRVAAEVLAPDRVDEVAQALLAAEGEVWDR